MGDHSGTPRVDSFLVFADSLFALNSSDSHGADASRVFFLSYYQYGHRSGALANPARIDERAHKELAKDGFQTFKKPKIANFK